MLINSIVNLSGFFVEYFCIVLGHTAVMDEEDRQEFREYVSINSSRFDKFVIKLARSLGIDILQCEDLKAAWLKLSDKYGSPV